MATEPLIHCSGSFWEVNEIWYCVRGLTNASTGMFRESSCGGFVGRLGSLSVHCGYFKAVAVKQSFQRRRRETRAPVNICKTNCREIITLVSQSHVCRLAAVMPKDGKRGVNPVWASAQNLLLVYIDKTQWQRRCMVQVLQQDEPVEDMTTHA